MPSLSIGLELSAIGAGAGDPSLAFVNALAQNSTLVSQRGPAFSLTRATTSYVKDWEGLLKPINAGEARFQGLRRVENLVTATEDATSASWSKEAGVTAPAPDTLSWSTASSPGAFYQAVTLAGGGTAALRTVRWTVEMKAGTASQVYLAITDNVAYSAGRATQVLIPLTTSYQRYSISLTFSSAATNTQIVGVIMQEGKFSNPNGVTGTVNVRKMQLEDVTGQSNQNPSEYVSKGVLSSPWYGAGVDGVRYFATQNGNTVASNVVTAGVGAPLTLTSAGLSAFGAATNLLLWSEDYSNAAWTKASVTVATDVTPGPDGLTTADKIQEDNTNSNHRIEQAVTFTAATYTASAFVKAAERGFCQLRIFNSGASGTCTAVVNLTTGAVGTTTGSPAVGVEQYINGWWRISLTAAQSAAAGNLGIFPLPSDNGGAAYLGTTGSGIYSVGAMVSLVRGAPYIKTTTAQVPCNADSVTANGAGVINQTEGTLFVKAIGPADTSLGINLFTLDDGTGNNFIGLQQVAAQPRFAIINGGVSQATINTGTTLTAGVAAKMAGRYRLNDSNAAKNGTLGTQDTSCTMPATTTFGFTFGGQAQPNTLIQEVRYYNIGKSDAELAALTA